MPNGIKRLLPHAAILICNMFVVLFLIDRVNTAMNFIDNRLTKGLLLALCVVSWFNCKALLKPERPAQRPAPRPAARRDSGYGAYAQGDRGYGATRSRTLPDYDRMPRYDRGGASRYPQAGRRATPAPRGREVRY